MIELKQVEKKIGKNKVLTAMDVDLDPAKVTLLVAPNGYGKSTLLKLIINALVLTSGKILVPKDCSISYVGEENNFQDHEKVKTILVKECLLSGIAYKNPKVASVINALNLAELLARPYKSLSKGQKRRLAVARGLLSSAKLLILDEPFDGLDAIGKERLYELILYRKTNGKGALISTHGLFELERISDQVLFLSKDSYGLFLIEEVMKEPEKICSHFGVSYSEVMRNNLNKLYIGLHE